MQKEIENYNLILENIITKAHQAQQSLLTYHPQQLSTHLSELRSFLDDFPDPLPILIKPAIIAPKEEFLKQNLF